MGHICQHSGDFCFSGLKDHIQQSHLQMYISLRALIVEDSLYSITVLQNNCYVYQSFTIQLPSYTQIALNLSFILLQIPKYTVTIIIHSLQTAVTLNYIFLWSKQKLLQCDQQNMMSGTSFTATFLNSTTHLSCGHKVLVIMNGEAENIISVSFVKSLLMTGWTVDYSKCCHMEHYLIRLGVE